MSEPVPVETAAREDHHADEPDQQPEDAIDPDRLIGQEQGSDDDGEKRHSRGQDRRDRGIDGPFCPGDQGEWDHDVHDGHHDEVSVDPAFAWELLVGCADDDPEQCSSDRESQRDERERPEVVDGDLDEEVARPPHEAECQEEEPFEAGRARAHRGMIPAVGLWR